MWLFCHWSLCPILVTKIWYLFFTIFWSHSYLLKLRRKEVGSYRAREGSSDLIFNFCYMCETWQAFPWISYYYGKHLPAVNIKLFTCHIPISKHLPPTILSEYSVSAARNLCTGSTYRNVSGFLLLPLYRSPIRLTYLKSKCHPRISDYTIFWDKSSV